MEEDACAYTIDDDFTLNVEEDISDIFKNSEFVKVTTQDSSKETRNLVNEAPTTTVSGLTKKHSFWKCEACSYKTLHEVSFCKHVKMHAKSRKAKLHKCKCPGCNFCTLRSRSLTMHIMNKHNPAKLKVYRCRKCSFKTEELGELEEHTKSEHKEKCALCQFETHGKGSKKKLEAHMKSHRPKVKNVRVYKCDSCSYESLWSTNVVRHRARHLVQQQ